MTPTDGGTRPGGNAIFLDTLYVGSRAITNASCSGVSTALEQ
jgi:hypothetical protein